MVFTYTPSSTPTDRTLVRYHTGDTESATAMWQDYNTSTAPDGTRLGSHNFCGMYELP